MKRPPFTLIGDGVSNDTKEALAQLTAMEDRGEMIGLAFAVMLKERHFFVNVAGEAYRNPSFACSCVRVLEAELVDKIRGRPNAL